MPRYEHNQIIKRLTSLDELPNDDETLRSWITAEDHLQFLADNARSQEIVVYAAPEYSFIYCMAVPEESLNPIDKEDLLKWSVNPNRSAASYVSDGGREGIWVERGPGAGLTGSETLSQGTQLIYRRTFEGLNGDDRDYFELSQEYAHLEELHWRPEQRGYCRFDENGDMVPIISITKRGSKEPISLVTFDRSSLECYLAASNQVLVRLFDFTLYDRSNFYGWGDEAEQVYDESDRIFYRQKISGSAAYTRGVQIIRPDRPKSEIFDEIQGSWFGTEAKNHVEFIAFDFRNNCVRKISTDPAATTNYFEEKDDLPFELSPAFFKPEVLLKYKADKDKYTVGERDIHCRAAWFLEAFDVNEAGQVFAYICYLRRLPEGELLHWLSYNEEPRASISKRAYINDFKGDFVSFEDPLEKVKRLVRTWKDKRYPWWVLRDDNLIDKVTVPLTASRDEWSDAFLSLSQLINEGFVVKAIRNGLDAKQVNYNKQEGSLSLLEKLISHDTPADEETYRLIGLREAQLIRTKVKGHSAKSDAEELAHQAISEHETFAAHFRHVCEKTYDEMLLIQDQFDPPVESE